MIRTLAIGLVFLCAIGAAAIARYAPQMPLLLREGFPAPVWPAAGRFAAVPGVSSALSHRMSSLPEVARSRFNEAGGRALLVVRDGQVIHEVYGPGHDAGTRFNSYSMVKSLVGLLVLRAVADGHISSLDQPLARYLGPDAPAITVADTLRMTSGLHLAGESPKVEATTPLDDGAFSPFSPLGRLHAFGIEAILPDLRVDADSQGRFHYQSANTALLGLLVETVYDQPLETVLSRLLWLPAGAGAAHWRQTPTSDRVSAYCCLYATARDWALVAQYILDNGTEAAPLLPPDLWRAWIQPELPAEMRRAGWYGFHLRHDVLDRTGEALQGPFAYMMGHAGQVLYLLPQEGIAVLRFGESPQLLHSTLYELFPEG